MTQPMKRVYVLCAINYSDFEVVAVFEALTDALDFGDQLIMLNRRDYPDYWTERKSDLRWDLFIREFSKVPTSGPYLSIQEFHVTPWSKSPSAGEKR